LFANKFEDVMKTYAIIEGITGVYEDLSLQKHAIYRDELKDQDQAAKELLKLVEAFPGEMSFVSLAVEYLRSIGRQDEAMQLIQDAQRYNPNDGRMQFQLSEYYAQKGDDATSFEHLKLAFACTDFPVDQRIALLLKFYNLSEVDPVAKERAYVLLLISDGVFPNEPKLLAMRGDYYARDMQLTDAITQYRRALELDPTRHPIWMQTLALEMETRDFSRMVIDAARALEYYPTTADFYYYLGFAHLRLHQYAQAVEDFATGKELVVDDMKLLIRFYERLGLTLHRLGNFSGAEEAFNYALALDKNADIVLCSYALALAERNQRITFAEEMVIKGLQRNSTYPDFLHAAACVQFRKGDFNAALKFIQDAAVDGSAEIFELYGDILSRVNRSNEALEYWRKAKDAGSTSKHLDQKIKEAKWSE